MSFVAICKELLDEGYSFVLSQKLVCQDEVEEFFAKQRHACGANSAPSFSDVVNNTHIMKVAQSTSVSKGTNCMVDNDSVVQNNPLARRNRKIK